MWYVSVSGEKINSVWHQICWHVTIFWYLLLLHCQTNSVLDDSQLIDLNTRLCLVTPCEVQPINKTTELCPLHVTCVGISLNLAGTVVC